MGATEQIARFALETRDRDELMMPEDAAESAPAHLWGIRLIDRVDDFVPMPAGSAS